MVHSSSPASHPSAQVQEVLSQQGKIGAGVRAKLQFYQFFIILEERGIKKINFPHSVIKCFCIVRKAKKYYWNQEMSLNENISECN